ncbi:MAG TPA: hypothetical protein VMW69_06900 [Spirochaetia bacterium]|nr:hypothetical protein [Spirochaetia bacterium]
MSFRKFLLPLSVGLSTACLSAGYLVAGHYVGAAFVLLPGVAVMFHRRLRFRWTALAYLTITVGFAAAGIFVANPPLLMVAGLVSAVAVWDLVDLDRWVAQSGAGAATHGTELLHLRSLALSLGSGLLLAAIGLTVSLHIPFFVLVVMILLFLFSGDRVYRYLAGRNKPD